MSMVSRRCFLALLAVTVFTGCSRTPTHYRKPTFKVTGKLVVDGEEPGAAVSIQCVPISQEDNDPAHYSLSGAMSAPDGAFEIATYESGDGVPDGEYVLTFIWGTMNIMTRSYGGPDKLKGRYSDAKTSEIKFTVDGQSVDLGEIELTTK